jgi:MFS transporter, DHA2 family, multidrug resistance protein
VDIKPLITLGGVLIAAMTSEFNDQVTVIALTDIRGALGISRDSGTCIESLYVSAEICRHGDLTLDGNDLHVVALDAFCHCAVLHIQRADPFSPNIEAIYALRLLQGWLEA